MVDMTSHTYPALPQQPQSDDDEMARILRRPSQQRQPSPLVQIGRQPILVTGIALVILIIGIGGIFGWRAYSGTVPEPERLTAARLQQARVAQASEQLVEKTKGIEATQQQSIDQLQAVQDQLQAMQRLLTAQQTETRKLTDQVGTLTALLDNLRQSFASAPANDDSARDAPRRSRPQAAGHRSRSRTAAVQRKRSR